MQPYFNILSVIGIIGVIQGLFLSLFILFHRSDNRRANLLLGLLLMVLSFDLAGVLLDYTRYYLVFPGLYLVTDPFGWLIAPALFLYVCALTQKDFRFRGLQLLHLIPSLLYLILLLPSILQSPESKLEEITKSYLDRMRGTEITGEFPDNWIAAVIFCTQPFVYIILIFRNLRRHAKSIREQFSFIETINLRWLNLLLVMIVVLWCVWFLFFIFSVNIDDIIILPVLFSFLVYSLGYFGLRQPAIFSQAKEKEAPKKYESSSLTAGQSKIILQRMTSAMEQDRLFKDPGLTLDKFADEINCPGRHVSQIINEQLNQNFFDFINRYRIEAAKQLIREKQNYTMLAVAYESGFHSKSSFNAAFKKYSGQTPTEFKKSVI